MQTQTHRSRRHPYEQLRTVVQTANELATDAGLGGEYVIDRSEYPADVVFCGPTAPDVVATWTSKDGIDLTESGESDDEFTLAVEFVLD